MELDITLCETVGESADRLLSAQIFMSGGSAELTNRNITKALSDAGRAIHGEPMTSLAAKKLLEKVKPRDTVIITSGFFDPPSMIGEADGPLGAALFARALCAMLDATPVFLTELNNVESMIALANSAGIEIVDLELARTTPFKGAIVVLPINAERAKKEAITCLDAVKPAALIAIEKPAPGRNGFYHTGVGLDVSAVVGKIDWIVDEANRRGVLTIGIGDGGNEVGMGSILEVIDDVVPTGKVIGTPLKTEVLVVAAVANWGAYGVEACIAAALHMPEAIHSIADERRVTETAARCGLIDPVTGLANGWVDGTPPVCSESILELLRNMVELRLMRKAKQSLQNFPRRWAERSKPDDVVSIWANRLALKEKEYFKS
jgi:hypothetical protein